MHWLIVPDRWNLVMFFLVIVCGYSIQLPSQHALRLSNFFASSQFGSAMHVWKPNDLSLKDCQWRWCLNEYSDVFLFNSMKFVRLVLLSFPLLLSWSFNSLQAKEQRVARLSCAMFKRPVVAAGDGFIVGHCETGHFQLLHCAWCYWHGGFGIW